MRFVLLFWMSFLSLFGNELIKTKEYLLAKDETKKVLVKYGEMQKLLTFRWTLFKNGGLVVFTVYDKIPSQHILYRNYTNQTLRIELKPRGTYDAMPPYILLRFESFDFEKHKAKLSLWLYDKRKEVYLRYFKR